MPTTASISVRVCRDTSSNENIGIQFLNFTSNNISSQFTAIFASVLSSTAMNMLAMNISIIMLINRKRSNTSRLA